jgi:hypothetical protein
MPRLLNALSIFTASLGSPATFPSRQKVDGELPMTDATTEFNDLVLTNPKLPPGWRPYHSDRTVTIGIQDSCEDTLFSSKALTEDA